MKAKSVNEVQSFKRGTGPHEKLSVGIHKTFFEGGDRIKMTTNIYMTHDGDVTYYDGNIYTQTEIEEHLSLLYKENEIVTVIHADDPNAAEFEFEGSRGLVMPQSFFENNPQNWIKI